uniref:Uncharacterized protein n=1 Tax=Lepeophtheirus salmonis TaxID=72036 RepID=A0A0K2UYD1_LEPSM
MHCFLCRKILDQVELNKVRDYITGIHIWVGNCQVEHPDTVMYTDGSKDEKGYKGAL